MTNSQFYFRPFIAFHFDLACVTSYRLPLYRTAETSASNISPPHKNQDGNQVQSIKKKKGSLVGKVNLGSYSPPTSLYYSALLRIDPPTSFSCQI